MFSRFERIVAIRYLRARREEGFISVIAFFSLIGIALGVATLIVVLAVMNGVRGELINSIIGIDGHITVYPNNSLPTKENGIANYDDLVGGISSVNHVKYAIPKIEGQVMANNKNISLGALVVGFKADDILKKELLKKKISHESIEPFKVGNGILIGSRMAEKMGVKRGDEITLISPNGRATIAGMVPRVKSYQVIGIFELGMFAYDNSLIIMPFSQAQLYFKLLENGQDMASAIEVRTDNPDNARLVAIDIAKKLGRNFRLYDWKSSNNNIFEAVIVQRNVMFLILTLIILVASFNVISSLIMLVREKGRDIAILRTMGASRASITRIFFMCGSSVGVIGTFIGLLLGLLIAFNTENIQLWLESMIGHKLFSAELYFLSHLPSRVDFSEVSGVIIFSLLLSFLSTIYPAYRAAKMNPAEALRYE
ncbi:MAG: lipoprotein-releasing ABC transporter permease subunit [Rickettsiales bacterium]